VAHVLAENCQSNIGGYRQSRQRFDRRRSHCRL
jgi:hypothetical protein